MANDSLTNKILGMTPVIEIAVRHLYWKNVRIYNKYFKKIVSKKSKKAKNIKDGKSYSENEFADILALIQKQCSSDSDSIILHSSYGELKKFEMNPTQIIDGFIGIVGQRGTLSMPAMPIIKNASKLDSYLKNNGDDHEIYTYSVQSKRVKTGALGAAMLNKSGCVRSLHPINTMASIGYHSERIMENNIDQDDNLPCGKNSSWRKCAELDSLIVGLGVDLTHSLTMIHVAEDAYEGSWPIKNWYRKKKFLIENNGVEISKTFDERRPKWGALHFAERTLCRDLLREGILHSTTLHGVNIEYLRSKALLEYLSSRNSNGYPYFFLGRNS